MNESQPNEEPEQTVFNKIINSLPVAERRPWFLTPSQKLADLKAMSSDTLKSISQRDRDGYLREWRDLVGNANTTKSADPTETVASIHTALQKLPSVSFFPHWVMDRYKEALGQFVRGEWVSSIMLCGCIVEFIVAQFMDTYKDSIPGRDSNPGNLKLRLVVLKAYDKLADDDYQRLDDIRYIRNNHAHNFVTKGELLDTSRQKQDSLLVLGKLSEFIDTENLLRKYQRYEPYMFYAARLAKEKWEREQNRTGQNK